MTCACPICCKPAAPRARNAAFPFCSKRCRLVDLGHWLTESYRVPGELAADGAAGPEESEGGPPPAPRR